MREKYRFSGHESFVCRQLWPKKAFDFVNAGGHFNNNDAIIDLGIGKNMVQSLRFWAKAIGITKEDKEFKILQKVLGDEGFDPYIEDIGTVWLLHYYLVHRRYASIYYVFFNDFKKQRHEFSQG